MILSAARFPLEDVVRIMTQMLAALAHAHGQGVVHRDLKPANMFLLDDGALKVVDFGIARIDDSEFTMLTSDGTVLGTPAYMSPEQVSALPADHRSDLFSAGIILYELLVGERPFTGETVHTVKQKVRNQEPLKPSEANPTLAPAWDKVISRALAKKPSARYESALQFSEAIKAAHQAERSHAEEGRLKAAEATEHAHRAAEERSRAESLRRADDERREAERVAKAESERAARAEAEARRQAEARAKRAPEERPSPSKPPASRTPAILAGVLLLVALALGAFLYIRKAADDEAKLEAARVVAEAKLKNEADKRAKAEALAREEAAMRSKLEADAAGRAAEQKAQAEAAARARAEEEARKAAEEKAKALALKKEEEERKKAEAAAKKKDEAEAAAKKKDEAEALAAAEAKRKAEEEVKAEAAKKAEEARLARKKPGRVFRDCSDCPQMVVIPAGEFTMGSPASEDGRDSDEGPQRRVTIAQPFAPARTEVIVGQFRRFVRESNRSVSGCYSFDGSKFKQDPNKSWEDPGFAQTDGSPVVCVNWNDAKAFVQWLAGRTGKGYRLPTEAEWEYAARAGSAAARYWGSSSSDACAYANVADQSAKRRFSGLTFHDCDDGNAFTAPVGSKRPNGFGLHDMLGNAWEWTEDCWNANYSGAPTDGSARLTGDCSKRVYRGGSWAPTEIADGQAYGERGAEGVDRACRHSPDGEAVAYRTGSIAKRRGRRQGASIPKRARRLAVARELIVFPRFKLRSSRERRAE